MKEFMKMLQNVLTCGRGTSLCIFEIKAKDGVYAFSFDAKSRRISLFL
jgi:hypothetical protein